MGIPMAKERRVCENRKRKLKASDKRITDLKQESLNNTEIVEFVVVKRVIIYRSLKRSKPL